MSRKRKNKKKRSRIKSGMTTLNILVSGRVQMVGYRLFCRGWARELKINGWVKNLHSGEVELLISGDKNNLDEFLKKLKEGPMLASVNNVEVKEIENQKLEGFEIIV